MLEITLIQDLARKNLCEVPRSVLNLTNLKMLYLEGNDISELPAELFILLDKLQWLDVRNNKLTSMPKTIMDHSCLETILMQNNDVVVLPLELGFIPNLKVLQLSGNPIKYPKKAIIDAGLPVITKFLRNEYISKEQNQDQGGDVENPRPNSRKSISSDFGKSQTNSRGTSSDNYSDSLYEMPIITLKSFHRMQDRNSRRVFRNKKQYKNRSKYSVYRNNPYSNSNRYLNMLPTLNSEDRIKEQMMKDVFLKKMQEMMCDQDELIQKQKDREATKKWRRNSKYKLKAPDVNYRPEVPFDYNDDYDRIPSRKEINTFIEKTRGKSFDSMRSYKPKKINVEKLITDIVDSLKAMEKEKNIEKTPKAQMDYAGREIKRILDLQKRLSALKIANDRNL